MTRQRFAPDWPKMMTLGTAASYVDLTPKEFVREVGGSLPLPVVVAGKQVWSRDQIDEALERVTGGDVANWRSQQPLYSRG